MMALACQAAKWNTNCSGLGVIVWYYIHIFPHNVFLSFICVMMWSIVQACLFWCMPLQQCFFKVFCCFSQLHSVGIICYSILYTKPMKWNDAKHWHRYVSFVSTDLLNTQPQPQHSMQQTCPGLLFHNEASEQFPLSDSSSDLGTKARCVCGTINSNTEHVEYHLSKKVWLSLILYIFYSWIFILCWFPPVSHLVKWVSCDAAVLIAHFGQVLASKK